MLKTNLHNFLLIDNIKFLTVQCIKTIIKTVIWLNIYIFKVCNAFIQDEQIYQEILY